MLKPFLGDVRGGGRGDERPRPKFSWFCSRVFFFIIGASPLASALCAMRAAKPACGDEQNVFPKPAVASLTPQIAA